MFHHPILSLWDRASMSPCGRGSRASRGLSLPPTQSQATEHTGNYAQVPISQAYAADLERTRAPEEEDGEA